MERAGNGSAKIDGCQNRTRLTDPIAPLQAFAWSGILISVRVQGSGIRDQE